MALYHSAKGSVNYTIVGSPTIVDGVISSISDSDYVISSSDFPNSQAWNNGFSFQIKIKTPSAYPSGRFLGLYFRNLADNVRPTDTGIIWRIGGSDNDVSADYSWQQNTTYYIRGIVSNKVAYLYIGTTQENLELVASLSLTDISLITPKPAFFGTSVVPNGPTNCSIDLNETYITVNGQPWFGVCPIEVKKHQLRGPVGYTVVGSPTIADGIASGFSSSNYLQTTSSFNPLSDYEITIHSKPSSSDSITTKGLLCIDDGEQRLALYFGLDSLLFRPYYTDSYNFLTINTTFDSNTYYYVHVKKNGYNVSLSYSLDGKTIIKTIEHIYSEPSTPRGSQSYPLRFGYITTVPSSFTGSIDLNETYIKVNGKLWFYQPAPTKYIVKDGKLVWADPNIYLQSSGTQYIDTNYKPSNSTTISYKGGMTNSTGGLFGVYINSSNGYYVASGGNYITFHNNGNSLMSSTQTGTLVTAQITPTAFSINNNLVDNYTLSILSNWSIYLYALQRGGYAGSYSDSKIYYFNIYNNGILVHQFVPVPQGLVIGSYTVPSNGMFDIVTQQFYANQGTGTFTIGRDE